MSLVCTECNKEFSMKSNLTRHLRMIHNLQVERLDILPHEYDVYHYKCLEGCNISFKYNRELRTHLKTCHEINLIEENFEFPNREELNKWLSFEEKQNCVQYVHVTATKRKSTGAETCYYECNRTGKANCVDDNIRKRKPRKYGTHKLNRGCTSQIIVNKSLDGAFSVNYFKTHYGHDIEVEHVQLSKQDRGTIASRLLLGIPIANVMDSYRNSSSSKRIKLLARKDILNIKSSFNNNSMKSSTININNWVNECSLNPLLDPVIYFKFENIIETNDLCLIIMTQTQRRILLEQSNSNILSIDRIELDNNDLILSTLFLINLENPNEFYPTACMLSNRKDEFIYELFFKKIFEKIGKVQTKIFINDINEIYFKSWCNVMDSNSVSFNYYNCYQIDVDWKRNLNKINSIETEVTKEKRKWVYDTLQILQTIQDLNEFNENFDETINLLKNDSDFEEFTKYFLNNYYNVEKWANCYKLKNDHNLLTVKQFELITEVLKQYIKQDDVKYVRFDQTFYSIIRFIRDETINYIIKNKNEEILLLTLINQRHLESISNCSKDQNLIIENISKQFWSVKMNSSSSNDNNYLIQQHMLKGCCNLICNCCKICLHCFSCTCTDFFINNTICQHIHYLWQKCFHSNIETNEDNLKEQIIIQVQSDDDEDENDNDQNDINDNNDTNDEISLLQNEIIEKISSLANNINKIDNKEILDIVYKNLDDLEQFVLTENDNQLINKEELIDNSNKTQENVNELGDTVLTDHSYL